MQISNILSSPTFDYKNRKLNNKFITSKNAGYRLTPQLNCDSVSFTSRIAALPVSDRMVRIAKHLLETNGFRKGQILYIEGDSYFLPFMNTLSAEAYKAGAKFVDFCVKEPKLEALKIKYNITEEFDYIKERSRNLKNIGALILKFDNKNDPYRKAKISPQEARAEMSKLNPRISYIVRDWFKMNPEEIFKTALDIHVGQPVHIQGAREHLPYILKLVEYLYSKNKTQLVEVELPTDNMKNLSNHIAEEFLDFVPSSIVSRKKEFLAKDVAYLKFEGNDAIPEGINPERWQIKCAAIDEAASEYDTGIDTPWLIYYLPTMKSALAAYPEFKGDGFKALAKAMRDAVKINRVGQLEKHVEHLEYRAKKLNTLLSSGYRTFHYVSVDPVTKLPNGKTDFKISMSPDSIFQGARMEMKRYGHNPIVNIPTEEVCTAPLANSAEGIISTTMPINIDGKIVEGIQFRFHKGKIVEVKADKNQKVLENYIATNQNADRLGELAIVADSPIKKMNRFFNSVLLDENAACHLALGDSYPDCVKGALDIEDFASQQKFLRNKHINTASVHNDFMVGDENIIITAINPKTGDSIPIIKDDKFLL